MSKQTEREAVILDTLKYKARLNTAEVVELLNISESTARRLFSELEQQGKVIRNYGGILLAQDNQAPYSFERLVEANVKEKCDIAAFAVGMIEDHDIVYIDSGTTLYQFCVDLAERLEKGKLKDVKFLTNSMANHQVLAPITDVILIGGEYRPKRKDFAGYASNRFIQQFNFTKCFLGADAISLTGGLMTTDADTASLVEIAIERSEKSIVLADSSKLGRTSFVSYSPLEKADVLVTSVNADGEILQKLKLKISVVHVV